MSHSSVASFLTREIHALDDFSNAQLDRVWEARQQLGETAVKAAVQEILANHHDEMRQIYKFFWFFFFPLYFFSSPHLSRRQTLTNNPHRQTGVKAMQLIKTTRSTSETFQASEPVGQPSLNLTTRETSANAKPSEPVSPPRCPSSRLCNEDAAASLDLFD